ncbi:hypothetical protein ED92_05085 [Amycolatopsis sp. MJM2582]|uniref:hypothetical protein n=1 Tax=Amycolatopsis TaxID=1813 RepID=UPI000501439F|nr:MULTISPECIES: hypothetical protein [unclassified Amycolatopsis]KFZ83279.1 hypothetical protein ED92_05085 [Amycolatopsis sp. MJM2582]RSN49352.1 hypothetical protein DMC64_01855 [Amycolatopsis sp. WAC 04197]
MENTLPMAKSVDEIVERELHRFWLAPGERLIIGCPPAHGYVGLVLDGELTLPYSASRETPAVTGKTRWPLPASDVLQGDWTDDPTIAYWVVARTADQTAVRLADHLAGGKGEARLTLSDRRLAVVYPARLLEGEDPAQPFRTFEEMPSGVVRSVSALYLGRSFPPRPVLQFVFADGSVVYQRDMLAVTKADRARSRR